MLDDMAAAASSTTAGHQAGLEREATSEASLASVMADAAPMADPAEIQGELWGANMIARNLRRRMRTRVMLESLDDAQQPGPSEIASLPPFYNMVLLGPAGAGKSSLIYTLWRALHFRAAGAATDETAAPDDGGDGGDDPAPPTNDGVLSG